MSEHPGLSDDWQIGSDGLRFRRAARVIIFDEDDRILLVRGHDFSDEHHWWWFTIGGGRNNDETPRENAVRELAEETGIHLDPADLVGPVLHRDALFRFRSETCRQDEVFFLARIDSTTNFSDDGLTELERDVLDELKWWHVDELEAEIKRGTDVYPRDLAKFVRLWLSGWDGSCPSITET